MANPILSENPSLSVREISDLYLQKNFRALQDYFNTQNQLLNFNFVEVVFTAAESNRKVAHGCNFLPQDVIITRVTGAGVPTVNWGLIDGTNLDITATGACRVRMYVGSYWNFTTTVGSAPTDTQSLSSGTTTSTTGLTSTTLTSTSSTFMAANTIKGNNTSISAAAQDLTVAQVTAMLGLSSVPTGTVLDYAAITAPTGYLVCDGSLVSRTTYAALFAIISTTFGVGDGSTTFGLPDLRGYVVAGKDSAVSPANRLTTSGNGFGANSVNIGAVGGAESLSLATTQMPSHNHSIIGGLGGGTLPINNAATNSFCGLNSTSLTYWDIAPAAGNHFLSFTGGGGPHSSVQPTFILNKIIKT